MLAMPCAMSSTFGLWASARPSARWWPSVQSSIVDRIDRLEPIVIVRLRNMTAIDATGLRALEDLADRVHKSERELILCGALPQPAALMHQSEFHEHIGELNICPNIEAALERGSEIHRRVFGEG